MANGLPYGDSFLVGTPALDRLQNQLYVEHKQREADRQRQIIGMDNEFSKNVAGVRDGDIGDITKAYGDWKLATQNLMKKKNGATPTEQLDVLRKKADMYKIINDSKSGKEDEEFQAKQYASHPENFIDQAGDYITAGRKMSMAQKRAYKLSNGSTIDLTNPNNLLYRDNTNWQPILQKAEGTLIQRGEPVLEPTKDGLQTKVTTIKAKNSPIEYYNSLISTFNKPRADEQFANKFAFTPEESQVITDEFERLKKENPAFKQAYGDVSFPDSSNLTPGLRTAKLMSMQYAIHNQPTSSFTMKDNKNEVMEKAAALSLKKQQIMEGIRQGNRMDLAKIKRGWQQLDQQAQNEIVEGVVNDYFKNPELIPEETLNKYKKTDDKGHKVDFTSKVTMPDGTIKLMVTDKKGEEIKKYTAIIGRRDLGETTRKRIETAQTDVHAVTNQAPNNKPDKSKRPSLETFIRH